METGWLQDNLVQSHAQSLAQMLFIYGKKKTGSSGDVWSFSKTLSGPTISYLARLFGNQLSLYGQTLAAQVDNKGTVQIFYQNQGGTNNWGAIRTIKGVIAYLAGVSIDLRGDSLAVGLAATSVSIYSRNQGGTNKWGLLKRISLPSTPSSIEVALAQNYLAVGDPLEINNITIYGINTGGTNQFGFYKRVTGGSSIAFGSFVFIVGMSNSGQSGAVSTFHT